MLIIQLFIFALFFLGFGLFSYFRKKKVIGIMFSLMGIMLIALGIIVVWMYPQTWPF